MSTPDEWINHLSRDEVRDFLERHREDDSRQLSLKYREMEGIPFPVIANQLRARQKAKDKLPEWYNSPCVIYPPLLNLEQASSELTAKYKSGIFRGDHLADLTGGTGIDTYYLSAGFRQTTYVEKEPFLCRLARHNFTCLGKDISIIESDTEQFLKETDQNGLSCFLDPSRRDTDKKKVYLLSDCSPNIITILTLLVSACEECLIKLSPMLDISQTIRDLDPYVSEIYIVAVDNEVKEILVRLAAADTSEPRITAVNLSEKKDWQEFRFHAQEETDAECEYNDRGEYLYEPNGAILKSGAFSLVAQRFKLQKAAKHSHIYFSDHYIGDFPGRIFKVDSISAYQPKQIKKDYKGQKANITTRNFPEEVKQIRHRTGIRDGGNMYLFFFRMDDGALRMARCRKPNTEHSEAEAG